MKTYLVGDLELTSDYWECECADNYIHPATHYSCHACHALRDEQPDARANEVRKYIFNEIAG